MRAVLVLFLLLMTRRRALRSLSPMMVPHTDFASLGRSFLA
jgi:hypothetical protein